MSEDASRSTQVASSEVDRRQEFLALDNRPLSSSLTEAIGMSRISRVNVKVNVKVTYATHVQILELRI